MWNRWHLPRAWPLWTLTLLGLLFWAGYNLLEHHAWFSNACRSQAQPNGSFADLAPGAPSLPPVFLDNDSLYWLHLATDRLAGGSWRPRLMDLDNVPWGRPNHWSSPLVWLMTGTARMAALVTGRSAAQWLESTAPWINPALFALLVIATAALLNRRLPSWIAGALVLTLAALPPIMRSFSALHVDHHGLIDIPAILMTLCLLLGLAAPPPESATPQTGAGTPARGWFGAAGMLGGLGLWFQASHQLVLIASTLGALLLWGLFARPGPSPARKAEAPRLLDPGLWRTWAVSGALVSLAAYLLEYAPSHMGLRLEVNHPLHALCWWGGTEAVLAVAEWRRTRRWTVSRGVILVLGLLPAVITLGLMHFAAERCFTVSTPFLQRIHSHIGEFAPLLATPRGANPLILLLLFNTLPLLALYGIGLWAGKSTPAHAKLPLHLALFTLLPVLVLCLRHNRYSSLLAAALWNMAVAVCLALARDAAPVRRRAAMAGIAAGAVASVLFTFSPLLHARLPFMPVDRWVTQMVARDAALEIAALPGFAGSRVVCSYNAAAPLAAFAHVQTTGGLYWENPDGLRAAAEFFTATDDDAALRIIGERGLRWVVFENSPGAIGSWLFYRHGAPSPVPPRATLAHRLTAPGLLPAWLEPVPAGQLPLATRAQYLVFRIR